MARFVRFERVSFGAGDADRAPIFVNPETVVSVDGALRPGVARLTFVNADRDEWSESVYGTPEEVVLALETGCANPPETAAKEV